MQSHIRLSTPSDEPGSIEGSGLRTSWDERGSGSGCCADTESTWGKSRQPGGLADERQEALLWL